MQIKFSNQSEKQRLARKGPAKVFGKDVDKREALTVPEAIEWFDGIWKSVLEEAVQKAEVCNIDFVRSKVPHYSQKYIQDNASHREFTLANCFFICQLPNPQTCNQLWFIPSASGDPRTLYVKFKTVPIKEEFDAIASELGWEKPEELGEKILLDVMETIRKKSYRGADEGESSAEGTEAAPTGESLW